MGNISPQTESFVDFPCLPNKKADPPFATSFSPPGGRKKKHAKPNQQPALKPETKIKNRFEIMSNLTFKTKASFSSLSNSSSSSHCSDKAKATKNKPQVKINKKVKIREFNEGYHGFSDKEQFANVGDPC